MIGRGSMSKETRKLRGLRRRSASRSVRSSAVGVALTLAAAQCAVGQTVPGTATFDDPFVQATSGLPACPVPLPPRYTEQQIRELAHERSQRGVSCWLDGRFRDTSVWALGQRRHVWLKGCVARAEQIDQLVALVSSVDDVQGVHSELRVASPAASTPAR